jgi:hypothetical protein
MRTPHSCSIKQGNVCVCMARQTRRKILPNEPHALTNTSELLSVRWLSRFRYVADMRSTVPAAPNS